MYHYRYMNNQQGVRSRRITFEQWVIGAWARKRADLINDQRYFMPCAWWLKIDGFIEVDFVGKFETIDKDFALLCEDLEILVPLGKNNQTSHKHYSHYYSPVTRAIIEEAFADDLKLFNYAFEDHCTNP